MLDLKAASPPVRRNRTTVTLDERLFALMMRGDDCSFAATYVMRKLAWKR